MTSTAILNMSVVNTSELSDHNALLLDCKYSLESKGFSYTPNTIKDMVKVNKNGRRVLYSLLKKNFNPAETTRVLNKIAAKGIPTKIMNNNYW